VITDVKEMRDLAASMMGRDFAFDVETSGLRAHQDRTLGLSLSYVDDNDDIVSEYVVFEHTLPSADDDTFGIPHDFIARSDAVAALTPVFAQTEVAMSAHNMAFDLGFLWKMGLDPKGELHDTMIGEFLLNENRESYGLKQTAERVFGARMAVYKNLHHYLNFAKEEFMAVPLEPAAAYAEDDTKYTYLLFERQLPMLDEEGLLTVFERLSMPLCRVIAEMQVKGFALDMAKVAELREEYGAISATHEHAVWSAGMDMIADWQEQGEDIPDTYLKMIDHLVKDGVPVQARVDDNNAPYDVHVRGRAVPVFQKTKRTKPRVPYFNVGSRTQLADLLYGYYGITVPTKVKVKTNKDGTVGVDKDTLKIIKHFMGDKAPKVLDDLLEWRKADKLIGTYLDPFSRMADPDDNYAIRANFNQTIARTGRLSSSSPNLQNVPSRGELGKKVRSLFVARPDHALIVCDYSQLELRLLAHYSQDEALLRAFTENLDLHTMTGARQAGLTYEELAERVANEDPEAKLLRTIGKSANFGLSYGMGAKKYQVYLLVNNGIYFDIEDVQKQIDGFNEAYPRLYAWKQEVFEEVRRKGYVKTIGGRKRRLPEIYSGDIWEARAAERQAVNVKAQGGGADIVGLAMIRIQERVRPYNAYNVVQVHDEIVVESPTEHAETVLQIVKDSMIEVNNLLKCPLAVEGTIGPNWYEAK